MAGDVYTFIPRNSPFGPGTFQPYPDTMAGNIHTKAFDLNAAYNIDVPVWNPQTRRYHSSRTGLPINNNSASGAYAPPAPTGDPTKDYAAISIPKDQQLSQDVKDMATKFKQISDASLQDFNSYLSNFKSDIAAARTAAAKASDITPTVQALTEAQRGYTGSLADATQEYRDALARTSGNTRGVISQEMGMLPSYDAAVNNVRNLELASLGPYMARYKLRTGTPTSASGAEVATLANAVAKVAAPFELQKIQKGYDILGNQALPNEQRIGANEIGFAGSYLPGTAGSIYQSNVNTATAIQGLKDRVAGMTMQNAIAFMQAARVPVDVQAQVLGLQLDELGKLVSLSGQANYQGLQYLPGANVEQPYGVNMNLPGYPTVSPRLPQRGPAVLPRNVVAAGGVVPYATPVQRGIPGTPESPVWNSNQYAYPIGPASAPPVAVADAGAYGGRPNAQYYDSATGTVRNADGSFAAYADSSSFGG